MPSPPNPSPSSIATALSFGEIRRSLAELDLDGLPAPAYAPLANALRRVPAEEAAGAPVRIAYLSNFTLDFLPPYVAVRAAAAGLAVSSYTAPFGQYFQAVLDGGDGGDGGNAGDITGTAGSLAAFKPDVVFLALSLRLLRPDPIARLHALSPDERRVLREEVAAHVEAWVGAAGRLGATLVVANFASPALPSAGAVADPKIPYGESELYLDLNLDLLRRFQGSPQVQVLDLDRVAAAFGKDRVLDRRLYYLAKMEWSPAFLPAIAGELVRHLIAARGLAKKCLVLDLDNTLWGGIVGEEGAAGVKIGPGDPEGEAYLDFQHRIKALEARGILLAVCSRNNLADVQEVFATRKEMALGLDDFAAVEISWDPKHEGLRRIARTLDLGLDSLVFVDDNPAEIALIRQLLPEVEAVELPADPAEYANRLDRLPWFEKAAVLPEDRRKTAQYRENRARREVAATAGDLETYLWSLKTVLRIYGAGTADLARAHQLFSKTNQFNLTTIRYSLPDLERLAASPDCHLGLAAASDRFGDLGTIAAFLLRSEGDVLTIDSLLLSCRALGRGVESAVMNAIKERFLRSGLSRLSGRFVPTARNLPAAGFYERQGFPLAGSTATGESLYSLGREEVRLIPCPWIAVETAGSHEE
jgi:FkbH-like protein